MFRDRLVPWLLLLYVQVWIIFPHDLSWSDSAWRAGVCGFRGGHAPGPGFPQRTSGRVFITQTVHSRIHLFHRSPCVNSSGWTIDKIEGSPETFRPLSSSASAGPWSHSYFTSFTYVSNMLHHREQRSTLTRHNPVFTLPQVQSETSSSAFRVRFHKCAQVKMDADPPRLIFFLLIHNMGPAGGTNLSQVAIRDSISGIVPRRTEGKVVERGFQTFAIDSLTAGSHLVVNYTADIQSHKSEVLNLPAFLTFSNASQNDVSMFGPLTANLTLTVNSTDRIYPNHGVHFAGFVGSFMVSLVLLSLVFLAVNRIGPRTRLNLLQQRRRGGDSDQDYADCSMSETAKDKAAFEDKMVDIMVLEDPQNMCQALENLEMSTLLCATASLEAMRVQIFKDVTASLLGSLRARGQISAQAQQRLLSVLHGQLLGMEGRLREERVTRMAAMADHCNMETREEMEAEHCREAAEKARAELLYHHAEQQDILRCSVLLEKLHKLSQSQLQRTLLARHEEASAKIQRQLIEWRRVELHKIFSEELEEATRMGELEKSTARSLQHDYFTCQDQLEEVLDVVLANQRFVLAERHAQRKFLVHSLHSLNSLISDSFSSTSSSLDSWFSNIRRGSTVPVEHLVRLQEQAEKELVLARQRLDEALGQERRAMRCGLIKKRRELISHTLQVHRQRQTDLSSLCRGLDGQQDVEQHLQCWQSLLMAHSLELAELINNLDEEAAADIRKVTMRVIQAALVEVKAIQPSAAQTLLTLWPPGAPHSLLFPEAEEGAVGPGGGQGAGALLQAQEKLHQEGKAALRTLSGKREALQEAMERELQEQRELRLHCRELFRRLCWSQLTLSEDDRLRMKLEFQKCLSVMDRCLLLPHAVSRAKLHACLEARTREGEQQREAAHTEKMRQSKEKSSESRQRVSELLLFQRRMEEKIQLLEKERETESNVMAQVNEAEEVQEEMQRERKDERRRQADALAAQMAAIHFQKVERRTKVLETCGVMVTLHGLLAQQLRESRGLERQEAAQSIQSHWQGLEEAEQQLERERAELEAAHPGVGAKPANTESKGEGGGEESPFVMQQDCRMAAILQEALYKREQIMALLAERWHGAAAEHQVTHDLQEQLELKRCYAKCDQDLELASQLVKLSQTPTEVLLEVLRLLLPTLPETELLSIVDALCPKQALGLSSAERESSGCPAKSSRTLPVRLKEDIVQKNVPDVPNCSAERERFYQKRNQLMERLFLQSSPTPLAVEEKEAVVMETPGDAAATADRAALPEIHEVAAATSTKDAVDPEDGVGVAPHSEVIINMAGVRLFVFRDPPESRPSLSAAGRKRRKNFLNLKKGSVAPADQP